MRASAHVPLHTDIENPKIGRIRRGGRDIIDCIVDVSFFGVAGGADVAAAVELRLRFWCMAIVIKKREDR